MRKRECPACRRRTALTRDGFCQKCDPIVIDKVATMRAYQLQQRELDRWLVGAIAEWQLFRDAEEAELWAAHAETCLPDPESPA